MKKVLCFLFALIMVFSMAGCSGNGTGAQETTTEYIFVYPTKEEIMKSLKVQAELQNITLPDAEVNEFTQMNFYTYRLDEDVKFVVKIDTRTNTVVNMEIDTRKEVTPAQEELRDKLMHMVIASIEQRETAERMNILAKNWKNAEADGAPLVSDIGVYYTKETVGEEDMYIYYAKL